MMGCLIAVGQHKRDVQFVREMIEYPSHKYMIPTGAASHALYLKRVHYNEEGMGKYWTRKYHVFKMQMKMPHC